jgi:iron(III) transport system permease protein
MANVVVGRGSGLPGNPRAGFAGIGRRGSLTQMLIQAGVVLVVGYLVLSPVLMLLYGSFRTSSPGSPGDFTLQNFKDVLDPRYLSALYNTIVVGVSAAVLCAIIGTGLAWLVYRTDMIGKSWLGVLLASTFYFPSFLTAEAWVILLAPRSGMLNNLIRVFFPEFEGFNIHTLGGIIFVTAIAYIPYTFLFLAAPLRSIDPAFEEAAAMSGASRLRTVFTVTLPLVSYAILSGALLTFILAIGLFGVPAILGMPAQIYVLATQIFSLLEFYPSNYGLAAALAMLLSCVTILTVWLQRYLVSRQSHTSITGKGYRPKLVNLGRSGRWIAFGICLAYFIIAVALPVFAFGYVSLQRFYTGRVDFSTLTLHHYREMLFSYPVTWRAFFNSFVLSAGGATIAIILCTLVSYIVVKGRSSYRGVLEMLAMMPAAIPGLVISVGLLWAYISSPIYGTMIILLVSYITHFMPQGMRIISSNLVQVDNSLEESARVAGASWARTLKDIIMPLIQPAMVTGWLLLFVAFFRELSTAVLLYSHGNEVLSVVIWDLHQNGNLGALSALAVMMLVVVYATFFLIQWISSYTKKIA